LVLQELWETKDPGDSRVLRDCKVIEERLERMETLVLTELLARREEQVLAVKLV
jgi:hypothetical protein